MLKTSSHVYKLFYSSKPQDTIGYISYFKGVKVTTAIHTVKYRNPSDLRSQASDGPVSTMVGDHMGILGAVVFFLHFCFIFIQTAMELANECKVICEYIYKKTSRHGAPVKGPPIAACTPWLRVLPLFFGGVGGHPTLSVHANTKNPKVQHLPSSPSSWWGIR
jgi:hypothetical protein